MFLSGLGILLIHLRISRLLIEKLIRQVFNLKPKRNAIMDFRKKMQFIIKNIATRIVQEIEKGKRDEAIDDFKENATAIKHKL